MRAAFIAIVIATALSLTMAAQAPMALRQVQVITLPKVEGRIDHLAFDSDRQRLFVAALGNDTVEVVDTAKGAHLRSLSGFHEPQGIAVVSDAATVAVANGDSGALTLIDATTLETRATIPIGGDADNVRYDPARHRVFVAAVGGIFGVDAKAGTVAQKIAINGHPESFQLDPGGPALFANVPGASQIVTADRTTGMVSARWSTATCGANYPMALDRTTSRLFVGCRRPASVAVFDTASGKPLASFASVGDTDDLFYDADRQRVYVIGGEGAVDVFARVGDGLRRLARVPTRDGARTGLWVASERRLYVAAPARGGQPAAIYVFEAVA